MAWVFNDAPADMDTGEMLVSLVLAEHANPEGGLAYPSVARIARMAHMSERGVQYCLRKLVERGIIEVQHEATNKRPTVYRFPAFRGAITSPQEQSRGATDDTLGVQSATSRGATVAPKPLREPLGEPSTPPTPPRGEYTVAFEEFWTKYPRVLNNSKHKAFRVWSNLSAKKRALAVAGLDKYLASDGWQRGFAPHATTYLNGALWESDPPPARMNGHSPPVDQAEVEAIKARTRSLGYQGVIEEIPRV
jgi:hypothetical protein